MGTQTHTILIVEDDTDSRQAISVMTESLGYRPLACASGPEALELLKDHKVALALLDIMMPGMDGYELLHEIRKLPDLEKLPIIMVTAKDQDSEILEGYRYGADYYIPKPFRINQLEYGIRLFLP